jgi:hypothetical protein
MEVIKELVEVRDMVYLVMVDTVKVEVNMDMVVIKVDYMAIKKEEVNLGEELVVVVTAENSEEERIDLGTQRQSLFYNPLLVVQHKLRLQVFFADFHRLRMYQYEYI